MEQVISHWEVICSIGLIIMSYARIDSDFKAMKHRVNALERKSEAQDAKLIKVSVDVAEIKGLTWMIYDRVRGDK